MHDATGFILENTELLTPPLVPEIRLRLASEALPLWEKTEEELEAIGLPPPYWAFAWAGGQALARHVLDNPALVAGRRVLDFASGSGLVAIAAMMAGAHEAVAAEIDDLACAAIAQNAAENSVAVETARDDLIGRGPLAEAGGWDVVLVGDAFYEKPLADRLLPWLLKLSARGADVLVGDPGRTYMPKTGFVRLATYEVPVTRALEDSEIKRTSVWRLASDGSGGHAA
jgi:predicted nicotinamide N-methyase